MRSFRLLTLLLLASCAEGPPPLHGYPSEAACLADEALYESLPLPDFVKRRLLISRDSLLVKDTALYPCGEAVTVYRQEWERYYGASKQALEHP